MKQSHMLIAGAVIIGGLYYMMQRKKTAQAADSGNGNATQEKISQAVVSLQEKQKNGFPMAVRKEFNIIVPPAAVSEKVLAEVAEIQEQRQTEMRKNAKPPLYL